MVISLVTLHIWLKANLQYYKTSKTDFENRTKITSLFANQTASMNHTLDEASNETSILIAKNGKNHTMGEQLLKPAIPVFVKKFYKKMTKMYKLSQLVTAQLAEESMRWARLKELCNGCLRNVKRSSFL